tara:strand:- start:6318 stop:7961 length:1644 start_codon:yes stop_codon:yes gene_type:complete
MDLQMNNISYIDFYLLNVNKKYVGSLPQVTSVDTFMGMTKNFHPEGIYSTELYGPVGSTERDENFAYIDVKIPIISPVVCRALFELKKLYQEICSGTRYAVWDAKKKDFEPATPTDPGADTGFTFFLSHYDELKPSRNDSSRRDKTLDFFEKFRDIALSRYVLTLPAGLRDLIIDGDSDQEEEIGTYYRKLITLARAIPDRGAPTRLTDPARWKLQQTFNDIYMYFFDFMNGKKGYNRAKVTSRKIVNGTRNVISSFKSGSVKMDGVDAIRPTDTVVGLYQGLKALLPVAQHHIRNKYIAGALAGDGNMYGVNKKTLKREFMEIDSEVYDMFSTDEGVEKLINKFTDHDARHAPVMIDKDHYLALIYQDEKTFKVFYDIGELPEGMDKSKVTGLSLSELLYLSGYHVWNDYFLFVTRYPVTGQGSTYSSTIRLETTASSLVKYERGDGWEAVEDPSRAAISFPRKDIDEFVTSMAPHPTRINGLGADFDGDTSSGNAAMSQEALEENRKIMNSKHYWFNADGSMKITLTNDVIDRTMFALLKEPKEW